MRTWFTSPSLRRTRLVWALLAAALAVPAFAAETSLRGCSSSRREVMERNARIQIRTFEDAARLHERRTGSLPRSLPEMLGHELDRLPPDPWTNPWGYWIEDGKVRIVSAGPDGLPGTPDDITNWSAP